MTDEQRTKAIRMRQEGHTLSAIGAAIGVSVATAHRLVRSVERGPLIHTSDPSRGAVERNQLVVAMRRRGAILREIGAAVGLSHECVRMICAAAGAYPPPRPQRWPIPGFQRAMRRHLYSAGYYCCYVCRLWITRASFAPSDMYTCRACATNRHRKYVQRIQKQGVTV